LYLHYINKENEDVNVKNKEIKMYASYEKLIAGIVNYQEFMVFFNNFTILILAHPLNIT